MRTARGFALTLLVAMSIAASAVLAQPPRELDHYVLFAVEQYRANGSSIEAGDVGVNDGRLVAARPIDAPTSLLVAEDVSLDRAAQCAGVFANAGKASTECGPLQPFTGPILPDVAAACGMPASFPVCDGRQAIVVTHGTTRVLAPGVYGDVVVKGGGSGPATLQLTGGRYVFCGLGVGRRSHLVLDAATELYIAGDMQLGAGAILAPGATSLSPGAIQVFVDGGGVRFSRRARVAAKVCAPGASLRIASGADLTGQFVAREIVSQRMVARGITGAPTSTTSSTSTTTTSSSSTTTTSSSTSTTTSTTAPSTTTTTSTTSTTSTTVPSTTTTTTTRPPTTTTTTTTTTTLPSTTTTTTSVPTTTSTTTSTTSTTATVPTTTSTTSSTTTTIPAGVVCGPDGVSARITVPYNQVGAPPLSGIRLSVGYPNTLSIPTIPGTAFVDPSRLTDLTGVNGSLLAQNVASALDVVYVIAGTTFPPGNLVSALFSCEAGTPVALSQFTCLVTSASDRVGNDVANPGNIPCSVAGLTLP